MEKDVVQIRCLSDNKRYADLINGVVFGGRQVVHGDDLREMDSQTGLWKVFPGKKVRKASKRYRDLVRKVAMGVNFTIIGVENQDKVHYLMPLRTMVYDVEEYERQAAYIRKRVREDGNATDAEFLSGFTKTNRFHPCVTLVVFRCFSFRFEADIRFYPYVGRQKRIEAADPGRCRLSEYG